MVRANRNFLRALSLIRTTDVEINYHCRSCKGYYTASVPVRSLARSACRCGSPDVMLLSVQAEPASPLLRDRPAALPHSA
jgi:hypothetical protein